MGLRGPAGQDKRVVAPSGAPKAPGLEGEALAEWKRVTGEMAKVGTLAATDRAAITEYCIAWTQKRQIERELDEQGWSFTTENGQIKQNPLANIALRLAGLMQTYLNLFGLTPAGRMRVSQSEKKQKIDPLTDF